jgi:hypothetical protein
VRWCTSTQGSKSLVDVELIKLSNRFKVGLWSGKGASETNLNLNVQNADGTIKYTKAVLGKGTKRGFVLLCSGKNAKIALEKSLKDAIAQIVEDPEFIKALLENPQKTPVHSKS